MRTAIRVAALAAILTTVGCADQFQRTPLSSDRRASIVRTSLGPVPVDPDFRLTAEQRRDIRPLFDGDALETFLAALPAARRADTFDLFRRRNPGESVPLLTDIGGGPLQELLDEVWAPRWLAVPDLLLTSPSAASARSYELPGRAAALRRIRSEEAKPR